MKIHLTKKTLKAALDVLTRVIPSRSSNPVLTAMHATASRGGSLILSGTNLEIDVRIGVPCEVDADHDFLVPAHLFAQIITNLASELIELEVLGTQIHVRAGGSSTALQLGDVAAYPPLTFAHSGDMGVTAPDLLRLITRTRYAASNEAFQAVFRGLHFSSDGGGSLRGVGSDGYRLAIYRVPFTGPAVSMIVPARSTDEIVRVFKADETLSLGVHNHMLTITGRVARMNVKLLDGDFPDTERVIPRQVRGSFTLPAARLKESVNRVAVLADPHAHRRVDAAVGEGRVTLSSENDYGRARDTFEAVTAGEPGSLGMNSRFVLDALAGAEGEVTVTLAPGTGPFTLRASGDPEMLAVIVPLKS